MKLSELSDRSGTPVATIKFYLREGLLRPGQPVTATLADYGPAHLTRLGTISTLRRAVGLSVAQVRAVVGLIDEGADRIEVMKALQAVIQRLDAPRPGRTAAGNQVVAAVGWPDVPTGARAALDAHLEAMAALGVMPTDAQLAAYARAVVGGCQAGAGSVGAGSAPSLACAGLMFWLTWKKLSGS
ncbi:MerR family transcriptional regulator [Sinomonas sp. R1AF57]|uniref:MerR family transcriptional regulator n=1 Tax=Sinomonas sp. R1AF57 TaxID=2020377 RepID=UPI001ABF42BE|nr:MerR family transcriptional regulator [Sinomonas sp. R1AF57]